MLHVLEPPLSFLLMKGGYVRKHLGSRNVLSPSTIFGEKLQAPLSFDQ